MSMSSVLPTPCHTTKLSLSDRFTVLGTKPDPTMRIERHEPRSRSRSRSRGRQSQTQTQATLTNQRLLREFTRKHKFRTAMKLKRRSLRAVGGAANGNLPNRNGARVMRLAPNGRRYSVNSLPRAATMRADYVAQPGDQRRPLRRSNSIPGRLNTRRPIVGGAAQRVARRRLERLRDHSNIRGPVGGARQNIGAVRRSRSRSRSRARLAPQAAMNGRIERQGRSASRGRRGRSLSRNRRGNINNNKNNAGARNTGGIKARLGIAADNNQNNRRSRSIPRRGVANGRVQKRYNNNNQHNRGRINGQNGAGGRMSRPRARSALRNANINNRSRSRTRRANGVGGQQQQQQQRGSGSVRRPGRSLQRKGNGINRQNVGNKKNNANNNNRNNNGQKQQQQNKGQQRRGRSRNRVNRGGPNNRKLGKTDAPPTREALDKDLDEYMTSKTEGDAGFI